MSEPQDPQPPEEADPTQPPVRRRPGRVRRWVVRPFVWGLLLVAVALGVALFFVQSRLAHERFLALLVARTSDYLGREIQIGEVDYDFFPLAIELRDAVLPGPLPGDPPVARAPYVRIQFAVRDLRRRIFDIEQIEVVRPDVYVQLNPDGTTNLPKFRTRTGGRPSRFDVRVGRILIEKGTFRYNDRVLPLELSARSVWGRAIGKAERGGEGGTRLDMLVTAQEVVTTLPRALPYAFTLSAKGSVSPREGRIRIANVRLAGPDLLAHADGFVDYRAENRRVELRLTGQGATSIANRLGYLEEPIAGPFEAEALFHLAGRDWRYSGFASSPRVAILNRVFEALEAGFEGRREGLDVDLRQARYAGGSLRGDIVIDTRGERAEGTGLPVDLDLLLSGLSLEPLIADQFPGEDLPIVSGLSGRVTGTFRYRFDSAVPLAGSGLADLRVEGASDRGLPLSGHLPLVLKDGVITSEDTRLTAPSQDVVVSGFRYDLQRNDGQLDFRLASRDVGPLAPLLAGEPVQGEEPPFWLPTEGQGTAEGTVTFAGKDVSVRVGLDLEGAVAPALTADRVSGSFTFSPAAVDDLRLEMTQGEGALLLTGRIPLPEEGKTVAAEPMALAIDAVQWPVPSLRYFLADLLPADLAGEIEGQVSGRLDLGGFPERLTGRVAAEVQDLVVSGNRVGLARAELDFNQGSIVVERASVETPAGILVARGRFDQATEGLDFTLDPTSLSLAAEPFRQLLPELTGTMEVQARVAGTLQQPDAVLSVRGRELIFRGRPLGEGGETAVQATWRGDRVEVEGSLLGLISFDGGGRLDRAGADVLVNLRSGRLGALAGLLAPQPLPDFAGSLAGTLGITANFSAQTSQALLRLAELSLQYKGRTISNLEPVVVALTGDRVEIRSFYLGDAPTKSEVFASGTLGLGGEEVPLDLRIQATLAAAWAELALPNVDVEGNLDLLATMRGTLENPVLSGQGDLTGGQVIVPDFPQAFEDVTAAISFNRDRIVLEQLRGRLGGGALQANGTLTLPGPGRGLSYRLGLTAQDVSVRYPEGFLNRGNADLALVSTESGRQISGQVNIERTLYVEDIQVNTLELLQSMLQRQRLEVEETDNLLATTQLNVFVRGPDALRVRNNLADIRGDIDLTVRGTLASPVVFGEVEAEEGGKIVFNDTEYEIERGTVTFNNPYRIEPVIDLAARTEVRNFEIILNLEGPLDRLKTNFSSNANLADLEILALLATGRPLEDPVVSTGTTAAQEVAPGQLAQQFLYGQAASALSQRVGTLFGFDRFRIDPLASTGQAISGVGITVGKRLSRDVFVTYSTDPTSERQYVVQVEWQIQANVTLVLTQAGDGTYAVDAQWERRF